MNSLDPKLRRDLEKAVIKARDVAEEAAKDALNRLAVGEPKFHAEMTSGQKELRKRLRAKGRQLGDIKDENKKQSIHRLISECAYERWHQMLFARFLAENNLLMNSENVPVTLAECEELAYHEGAADGWMLASRYASRMLPQIFRPDDAVLQVQFAPEQLHELEEILSSLSTDVFTADDSIGWVYQFWQSKKKKEVNKSEKKIGADELPAVTQLFTEDYMVLFLLHNTIGAWWTARLLANGKIDKDKWDKCASEDDCRRHSATGAIAWEYLRFVKDEQTGEWRPAAGSFDGWPKYVRELTVLDPCCGSGHFLVAAFIILVYLMMKEEGISAQEASDIVLKNCLFGLEIDQRCTQIAAFALAFTAWKFPNAGRYRALPQLNIACSGLSVGTDKKEWIALANGDTRLNAGMERLYTLFEQAPTLGSLITPNRGGYDDLVEAGFQTLTPLLTEALKRNTSIGASILDSVGITAQGAAHAAEFLGQHYFLIVTNVPYLSSGRQDKSLKRFCESYARESKINLATVFIQRCLDFCKIGGAITLVTPQNWLFLGSYKKMRTKLLTTVSWNWIARLGTKAFQTPMWDFNILLFCMIADKPSAEKYMYGCDVQAVKSSTEKANLLRTIELLSVKQMDQLKNPDARITLEKSSDEPLLERYASSYVGIRTGDGNRFVIYFWEILNINGGWRFFQTTPNSTRHFDGCCYLLNWEDGKGALAQYQAELAQYSYASGAWKQGRHAWGKQGIAVGMMGNLSVALYSGDLFDTNTAIIIPKNPENLKAIWTFCSSRKFSDLVRRIDQKVNVTNATLVKVPFNLTHWESVARLNEPIPKEYSFDPTQWHFRGELTRSTNPLQVAVVRLLGYRWPKQKSDIVDDYIDDDGVVCIPANMGEKSAAGRLRELFATAYGKEWSPAKESELLHSVGFGESSLEDWLRNGFFEQHCQLFHQRPFIWHIWDGRKDGFSVLVNYHKLNYQLLERITYTYLNDWIKRQEGGEGGAEARFIAAKDLQKKLKLILEGESPYDIFVRWKPIEQQPIGWNPDLNDGVRLNIRPFVEANVLRKRPNINWNKDRGKDVESAPWYKVFKGERINDYHLTIDEKKASIQK